jgi:hypothetical protein
LICTTFDAKVLLKKNQARPTAKMVSLAYQPLYSSQDYFHFHVLYEEGIFRK